MSDECYDPNTGRYEWDIVDEAALAQRDAYLAGSYIPAMVGHVNLPTSAWKYPCDRKGAWFQVALQSYIAARIAGHAGQMDLGAALVELGDEYLKEGTKASAAWWGNDPTDIAAIMDDGAVDMKAVAAEYDQAALVAEPIGKVEINSNIQGIQETQKESAAKNPSVGDTAADTGSKLLCIPQVIGGFFFLPTKPETCLGLDWKGKAMLWGGRTIVWGGILFGIYSYFVGPRLAEGYARGKEDDDDNLLEESELVEMAGELV